MRLDTLLERLEYKVVQGSAETEVTTLINDSRKVENGSVFVCLCCPHCLSRAMHFSALTFSSDGTEFLL